MVIIMGWSFHQVGRYAVLFQLKGNLQQKILPKLHSNLKPKYVQHSEGSCFLSLSSADDEVDSLHQPGEQTAVQCLGNGISESATGNEADTTDLALNL